MKHPRLLLSLPLAMAALLTALPACSATPSAVSDSADGSVNAPQIASGTIEITANRPNLILRNTTETIVVYRLIDEELQTLALMAPCDARCPQIVQGASVTVPYTAITGYSDATKRVHLVWWTLRRAPDGTLRVDGELQSKRVTL